MNTPRIITALSVFVSLASFGQTPEALTVERSTAVDTTAMGVTVSNVSLGRHYDRMDATIDFDLSRLKMHGDRAIVYTPIIVAGGDSLQLSPVAIYGHTRWIQYQRKGLSPVGIPGETSFQYGKRPSTMAYSESVPYEEWMHQAELVLRRTDYGCCNHLIDTDMVPLASWEQVVYKPNLHYIRPVGVEVKRYALEGQSFVDFPVDQTVIYPDYRNNAFELDSIMRTINIARNNPDAVIDTIWLKGFASPESPYSHNTDLAIGRTKALKEYIQRLYNFDGVVMLTDYEPEDWAGLRERVDNSNLEHRDEILAIIDSDMAPDPKEWKIKSTYPQEYKFMLDTFYPPLRHTNYKVSYTVRSYSDPREIAEIMKTRPGTLSLNEFYLASSLYEPGTPEFNNVFETAALIFPTDATANLNAANSEIAIGNYKAAERYLEKAGDTGEADYARCIVSAVNGDYAQARAMLKSALAKGLEIPEQELADLRAVIGE